MKLKKKLITMLLIMSMTSMNVASVYAATLEVPQIGDTFLLENIQDTLTSISSGNSYIISAVNTIKANGPQIYGVQDTVIDTKGKWLDIKLDKTGKVMDNVVKIDSTTGLLVILDSKGDSYYLNSSSKYPVKIDVPTKVVDIAPSSFYNYATGSYSYIIYVIDENGDMYYMSLGSNKEVKKIDTDIKFKEIKLGEVVPVHINTSESIYAISRDSNLYTLSTDQKLVDKDIPNVEDIFGLPGSNGNAIINFTHGAYKYYDYDKNALYDIPVPEGEYIESVVSDNNFPFAVVRTNKGNYKFLNNKLEKMSDDTKLVAMNKRHVLTESSILSQFSDKTVNASIEPLEEYDLNVQPWINSNPIIPNYVLAGFNVDRNTILERYEQYTLEFNMVTYNKPVAFNLYYAKEETVDDKSTWVTIGTGIPADSLSPTEYDTGYQTALGEKIKGIKYKYAWTIGSEDLTNIKLIGEPIYK